VGIATTPDGGQIWRVHTWTGGVYPSLACPTVNRSYAVGGEGLVAIRDGGRTWTERQLGITWKFPQISCSSYTIWYVISGQPQLWRTRG